MGPLIASVAAVLAGALLLAWPVALNGAPLFFSDTGALLDMGLLPSMGWDKPFVYGPFLAVTSLRQTLLATGLVQTALLSYMLWASQSAFAPPRPIRHVLLCAVLAAATAAPWFASTLLPDAFTPLVALGLLTAAGRLPRRHAAPVAVVTALAIASHLSHLVLAAGLIAAIVLCRRRLPVRPLASLAAALLFLLASNLVGNGRLGVSPYGAIFALARLVADGPARDYLAEVCPAANLALCRWRDELTADSDQFLWDPASPFWADPLPLRDFAAEAATIVAGTLRTAPGAVLRHAYRNAVHQFDRADVGDTLVADHLALAVRPRIERFFPPDELARYDRSLQPGGALAPLAARLLPLQRATLLLAAAGCTLLLVAALRRPNPRADFAALILLALAANAFATGALSTVHDRYQARIAWLVVLPFLFAFSAPEPPSRNPPPAAPSSPPA